MGDEFPNNTMCPDESLDPVRDEMRDRFWNMFRNLKFKERFYAIHSRRAYNANFWFGNGTLFISFLSTLIWSTSGSAPVFWAVIIAVAQLAQSLKDSFVWGKQLSSLEYFLPEVQSLLLNVEDTWNEIDLCPEKWDSTRINEKRSEYSRLFSELEIKFTGSVHFSQRKKIIEQADLEADNYFDNRYKIPKEESDVKCQ